MKCQKCELRKNVQIPKKLIDKVHNVVLFVGSGVSTESKMFFPDTLFSTICAELNIDKNPKISFSKLMSMYCKKHKGRHQLMNKIKERFDYFKAWPELNRCVTEFYEEIAQFPCVENIITTNWDSYFEDISKALPFVYPEDIIFWDQPGKKVLKIHGSINNLGSIVATEEDYNECYKKLNKGVIGSQLKLFLAKNILIFIGYSFQDEDFQRIYNFIKKEMKAYKKQAYIVTIDKNSGKEWRKKGLIPIYTGGAHFIKQWREKIEKKGCLAKRENLAAVAFMLDKLSKIHQGLPDKFKIKKYPDVVYCYYYQDGIIHALEYLLNKVDYGYTLCIQKICNALNCYEYMAKTYRKNKNWMDYSYLKGYINGMFFVLACLKGEEKTAIMLQNFYYNAYFDEEYSDEKEFRKSLKKINPRSNVRKYTEKYIDKVAPNGLIPHHIPRL